MDREVQSILLIQKFALKFARAKREMKDSWLSL